MGKDRREDALKVLHRLRRKEDVANGVCELELAALQQDTQGGFQKKGSWLELFNAKNRRRTK